MSCGTRPRTDAASGCGSNGLPAFPQQRLEEFGDVDRGLHPELCLGEVEAHLHADIVLPQAGDAALVF